MNDRHRRVARLKAQYIHRKRRKLIVAYKSMSEPFEKAMKQINELMGRIRRKWEGK
ncbi:hypothetical protein P3T75_10930 [Enterococcus montenegrensis]|uniref:hypothetical protein n=1 Tax=Enterococcus montenegrensis TaxID=3031993 RepID=UPI00249F3C0E|nr:hypothetical protein [Enterococcus montenegrensis]WHA08807.1 hypothetical protein P3T75_10930 [Enterococcus montenegrensis]